MLGVIYRAEAGKTKFLLKNSAGVWLPASADEDLGSANRLEV